MEKIKLDLGKYDIVFENGKDNDIEISVFEKSIYYKRSLSTDEVNAMISLLQSGITSTNPLPFASV